MKNTLNKKIDILTKVGFIPSGLNIPIEMKIQDVRATKYDYTGNNYAAPHESFENIAIAIKFQHSKVDKPFWITVFQGATYREESTTCIIATNEITICENYHIQTATGTVYKTDCITCDNEELNGIESIKEVLFAFNCRLIDGDESGLYTNNEAPIFDNSGIFTEIVDELISLSFIEINGRLSKDNPNSIYLKEIQNHLLEAASGKLYKVTVVSDSSIKAIEEFLLEENAEKVFVNYCLEYYSNNGIKQYCNSKGYESFEELSIEEWKSYFHSEAWYDVNDLSNVEINLM